MISQALVDLQVKRDVELVLQIFQEAELEILKAINGKNLWRDQERLAMLSKIKKIIEQLEVDSIQQAVPLFESNYNDAIERFNIALKKAQELDPTIQPLAAKSMQIPSQSVVEYIASTKLGELTNNYQKEVKLILNEAYRNIDSSLKLVKKEVEELLIKEFGKAEVVGKSRTQLISKLVKKLEASGDFKDQKTVRIYRMIKDKQYFVDKNITVIKVPSTATKSGTINLSLRAYIHGLTQSTMITTRASAVIQRSLEYGNDFVQISTHANPSRMCAKWQGQVVSISGESKKYSSLKDSLFKKDYEKGGIFHRYCRHGLYVYFEPRVKKAQ